MYNSGRSINNHFFRLLKKIILCRKVFSRFSRKDKANRILHIQFIAFENIFYLYFFRRCFSYYVLSFWGSDLLKQSKGKLLLMLPLFFFSKKITFETEEMKDIFLEKLPLFRNSRKLCYARFGLSELDEIDKISPENLDSFRTEYGLEKSLPVVVLGYNRRIEQQHIPVLESIEEDLSKKIQFLIPWSYGNLEEGYYEKLHKILEDKKCKYVFMKKFLTDKEIACLRLITDIFIQVQITDSLSACMLESLYAGKKVITGSWLPYKFLDEKGIKMFKVDNPSEVGNVLTSILNDKNINAKKNSEVVASFAKWNECINDWLSLYE